MFIFEPLTRSNS